MVEGGRGQPTQWPPASADDVPHCNVVSVGRAGSQRSSLRPQRRVCLEERRAVRCPIVGSLHVPILSSLLKSFPLPHFFLVKIVINSVKKGPGSCVLGNSIKTIPVMARPKLASLLSKSSAASRAAGRGERKLSRCRRLGRRRRLVLWWCSSSSPSSKRRRQRHWGRRRCDFALHHRECFCALAVCG